VIIKLISREKRKRENGSNTSSLIYINVKKLDIVANSEDKKKFFEEYLIAYRQEIKPRKPIIGQPKNQSLDKLIQSIGQLEPSINRQEEIFKDISSLNSREDFKKFKERIIETYRGKNLTQGVKGFLPTTIISISHIGYLHNEVSMKDLCHDDAITVWNWIYEDPSRLLPLNSEKKWMKF